MRTIPDLRVPATQRGSPSRHDIRVVAPQRPSRAERLGVVHLTAEYWPLARTGGLGEAVAGLANVQAARGMAVTVVMPLYRVIRESALGLQPVGAPFPVAVGPRVEEAQLYRGVEQTGGPRLFFVAHPCFDREGIYGEGGVDYSDNAGRFSLFCLAALHALPGIAPGARIVHAHDWHAALALAYLGAGRARRPDGRRLARVLSIHNAGFQGSFPPQKVTELGIPARLYNPEVVESYGRLNFLKGGLVSADVVVTVSPTHARELRTPEGGFGLHQTFTALGDRLVGILNGIDSEAWDPATDSMLPARYAARDPAGKQQCKTALQRAWGLLERPSSPLFAMCARFAEQKGLDLVIAADLAGAGEGAQFVFLGHGNARYERALADLAAAAPGRVALRLDFSDVLEHHVIAGADALLLPSLYEPCGLTQMRAQRYGTIPVARRVGGLADTVEDGVTGFLFDEYTPEALSNSLRRAATNYADSAGWRAMVRRAMAQDFGWERSAGRYLEVYRQAMQRARATFGASAPAAHDPHLNGERLVASNAVMLAETVERGEG